MPGNHQHWKPFFCKKTHNRIARIAGRVAQKGLRIKWCPIKGCKYVTTYMRSHLTHKHWLKAGVVLEKYLSVAIPYKGKSEEKKAAQKIRPEYHHQRKKHLPEEGNASHPLVLHLQNLHLHAVVLHQRPRPWPQLPPPPRPPPPILQCPGHLPHLRQHHLCPVCPSAQWPPVRNQKTTQTLAKTVHPPSSLLKSPQIVDTGGF